MNYSCKKLYYTVPCPLLEHWTNRCCRSVCFGKRSFWRWHHRVWTCGRSRYR